QHGDTAAFAHVPEPDPFPTATPVGVLEQAAEVSDGWTTGASAGPHLEQDIAPAAAEGADLELSAAPGGEGPLEDVFTPAPEAAMTVEAFAEPNEAVQEEEPAPDRDTENLLFLESLPLLARGEAPLKGARKITTDRLAAVALRLLLERGLVSEQDILDLLE
ncbi:MAG: hypothetical protein ACK4N5_18465, partial [Myxococcales bacterium]